MNDNPIPCFEFGGFKTLPLYTARGRLKEDLHPFGSAQMEILYDPPDYASPPYELTPEWLDTVGRDPMVARKVIDSVLPHLSNFQYFVQLQDDADHSLIRRLYSHIDLAAVLCDGRLGIDPTVLWNCFEGTSHFSSIHAEYRKDQERDAKYAEYAERLEKAWGILSRKQSDARWLVQRASRQIELKSGAWLNMPPLRASGDAGKRPSAQSCVRLFYSYSHKDESLREQLETHLSLLRRQLVISEWHDRRIGAGSEWKGRIDTHLESAHLILLLVSADFIASDYCYDVEMKRAMERHETQSACVIPVILRACDWTGAPFGKLQALPKDAKPIMSWANVDEAFTDVATGIRRTIQEMVQGARLSGGSDV